MTNQITIQGNLTKNPELKFTDGGTAVARFSVADNVRTLNKQTNEWEDGKTTYFNCIAFKQIAENAMESLEKGASVIIVGRIEQSEYEKDGEKKTYTQVIVENIAPSLKNATAKVTRLTRSTAQNKTVDDPWKTSDAPF